MGKRRGDQGKAKQPRVGDRPFRQIELRAFAHATEDPDKVRQALAFVAGLDLEQKPDKDHFEKTVQVATSQGHFRNPIQIFGLPLKRAALVRRFWDRVLAVDAIRSDLAGHVDRRLDDDLVFWFRLDKQEAAMSRLRMANGQDVVLVRAKLATYPKDRETGLLFLREFFSAKEPVTLL